MVPGDEQKAAQKKRCIDIPLCHHGSVVIHQLFGSSSQLLPLTLVAKKIRFDVTSCWDCIMRAELGRTSFPAIRHICKFFFD